MRKFVTVFLILAAFGLAAPPAQAGPVWAWVELGFKSSGNGLVYDNPYDTDGNGWPPNGAVFSSNFLASGLGTITYTFDTPGTHYVAGFFDYQYVDALNGNGIFDEEASWIGGALPTGWSGKSNDPWELDPSNPPPIYDQFLAFDDTHPFDDWVWNTPGHDVAVAYGYAFTLAPGVTRKVTFTVTDVAPASYLLRQSDPLSKQALYFNGAAQDVGGGGPVVPEPGTLTLLGLGLAMAARRLRRRG